MSCTLWQDAAITTEQWLQFGGRLHPLLLHLPIGLWFGIALLEFGSALIRRPAPRGSIAVLSWFAAIGGALAAVSGWLLALEGDFAPAVVDRHRWLGVAIGIAGVLAAIASAFRGRAAFRLLLLVVLGTLVPGSHLGGDMTHGRDFLTAPFRGPEPTPDPALSQGVPGRGPANGSAPATGEGAGATTPVAQGLTYANTVAPILARVCTSCHGINDKGQEKDKGGLMLHTVDRLRAGGDNGPVFVGGKPDESVMLQRIALPLDDEDHMPPEGKPQPTTTEVELLRAWIAAGAPFEGEFAAGGAGGLAAAPTARLRAQDAAEASAREGAPADEAALRVLREHFVHVAPDRAGSDLLAIGTAAVAPTYGDDEARRQLAPVAPLVAELDLSRSRIGDATLALCASMPKLRRLDLRSTRVTADGVQPLRNLPLLEELVLADTAVDDTVVPALLAMPALQRVWVWNTKLTAKGLDRLRGRQGLKVDAGDEAPAAALETEPKPEFRNELPLPGEDPIEVAKRRWSTPVNELCPVTQRPVDARFVVLHEQRAIGFCCADCPGQFWREPAKFPVTSRR